MQEAKKINLITKSGVELAARLFRNDRKKSNLIVVSSAAGATQRYYRKFAQYVSHNFDFDVLTFDYRGVGESLKHQIRQDQSYMSDWGSKDLNIAILWGRQYYEKVFLVGHSVAGQVFPKAENAKFISAAYFVCSQTAAHKFWSGWPKIVVLLFWYLALPLATRFYGYLPKWVLGGGEDLPLNVAREWRKWGIHPEGVLQGDKNVKEQFNQLHMPIHFVNIEDDQIFAPVAATRELMHYYGNAVTTFQHIRPKDLQVDKIGHFGFFSCSQKEKLWSMPIMYFTQYVKTLEEFSLADKDQ